METKFKQGINKSNKWVLVLLISLVVLAVVFIVISSVRSYQPEFNGRRAFHDVEYQVNLGPRIPRTKAHADTVEWIISELQEAGWETEIQETQMMEHPIRNIIGCIGDGKPWIILGAHYDTRMLADMDPAPKNRNLPVPGANDGASGVAVLLELARVLPQQQDLRIGLDQGKYQQICLVFFDAEDNGKIPGWEYILGSRAFVAELEEHPDAVVIVDMIGDAKLNIYLEKNSDPALSGEIWKKANELGYSDRFIPQYGHRILDDHVPFLQAGIPAVDIIDLDYDYWHTVSDTTDKIAVTSLQIVGETLLSWLTE